MALLSNKPLFYFCPHFLGDQFAKNIIKNCKRKNCGIVLIVLYSWHYFPFKKFAINRHYG